ncbi:MAG: hypothetical protein ABEK10_02270 [Candidatus Nanosalina sp.]
MGEFFRPDPLGMIDVTSAIFVYLTQSFMPAEILHIHAAILVIKGTGSFIRPAKLPFFVFVLGGMADVLSAAILFTGTPPLLVDYKKFLAGALLIKGLWSLFGLMQKF